MAIFDDWGKGESKPFDLKGEPLTREHLDDVVQWVRDQRGVVAERYLSFPAWKRAKVLAEKFEAGTITDPERLELKFLTGV